MNAASLFLKSSVNFLADVLDLTFSFLLGGMVFIDQLKGFSHHFGHTLFEVGKLFSEFSGKLDALGHEASFYTDVLLQQSFIDACFKRFDFPTESRLCLLEQ